MEHIKRLLNRPKLFELLRYLYWTSFVVRLTVFVALQVVYMEHKRRWKREGDLGERANIERQIKEVYGYMAQVGSVYRHLNATAVFLYSLYLAVALSFFFASKLFLKSSTHLDDQNLFYIFLTNSQASYRKTGPKLKNYIKQVLQSNKNYLLELETTHMCGHEWRYNLTILSYNSQDAQEQLNLRNSFLMFRDSSSRREEDRRSVKLQRAHLLDLLCNEWLIWPPNRNDRWRVELNQLGLKLYCYLTILWWLVYQIVAHWALQVVESDLLAANDKQPQLGHSFSHLDRLLMLESSLVVRPLTDLFVIPFTVLILNFWDQYKLLEQIHVKFVQFFAKVASVRRQEILAKTSQNQSASRSAHYCCSCDQEALELYLEFQFFSMELRSCLQLATFTMSQFFIFILVITMSILQYLRVVEGQELKLFAVSGVVSLLNADGILGAASAFSAKCVQLRFKSWSLIAQSTGDSQQQSAALLSTHTLLLWRRLAADERQMVDRFTCKLFDMFPISYNNVLKFNFWLISIFLLVLTMDQRD